MEPCWKDSSLTLNHALTPCRLLTDTLPHALPLAHWHTTSLLSHTHLKLGDVLLEAAAMSLLHCLNDALSNLLHQLGVGVVGW